jgi:hypothetical protein
MTFAPPTLVALGKYLVVNGAVNLGIVGDTAHQTTGTSYHLGQSQLKAGAYSTTSPRDREPALTEAASAIDIGKVGGTLAGLQKLSNWLARECANRAVDTLDIREVIWSPQGTTVVRWDREGIPPTTGSDSHLTHTHVSYFRDSEFRDHTALFRRYFEEQDVTITEVNAEDWKPGPATAPQRRPIRSTPDRAAGVIVGWVEVGEIVRTIAEAKTDDGNVWRLTERAQDPGWLLRSDFVALVQGGDAALHAQFDAFMARVPPVECPPAIDCTPLVNVARQEGTEAGLRDGARAVKDAAVNAAVLLGG